MDFPLWLAAVIVFILAVGVYVMLMIFLPEWVGITGKKALEAEKAHRGDYVAPNGTSSEPKKD